MNNWRYKLNPELVKRVEILLERLKEKGYEMKVVQGYRSFGQQAILWQQGRYRKGPRVTNAKAGMSPHNYGCAVDLALAKPVDEIKGKVKTGKLTYFPEYEIVNGKIVEARVWKVMADEAIKLGLEAGYYWKKQDRPHLQIGSNKFFASGQALKLWKTSGVERVWKVVTFTLKPIE